MQFHDAYKQGAFRLIEMQNQFRSIMSGQGFSFWSWYEGIGLDEPLEIFVDPFSFIASLFPIRYLELGFTFAALLRMYFGGIAFLLLGKEVALKKWQNLIGALMYVFSACFIGLALRQSEFLVEAYLFPLLVLGVEKIYKEKKAILFVLTVAYYMLISSYLAYMSAIVIVIYIALRYFAYKEGGIKDYALNLLSFIGYGLLGIMISSFSSIFSILATMRASTDSSFSTDGLFFKKSFYLDFGKFILGTGNTQDYLDIGLPILILILLPIAVRNISKKKTNTIMTVILFVMLLLPFFGRMFNGFGYVTFRWSYTFVLFATWSAAEQLDLEVIRKRSSVVLALAGYLIIAFWTLGLHYTGRIKIDSVSLSFITVQLFAGAAILIALAVMRRSDNFEAVFSKTVIVLTLISLTIGWSFDTRANIENFAHNASVYNNLNESTLRVSNKIEDKGFFRVDSVDGMGRHEELKFPTNENVWWKSKNLFIYNSTIPKSLTDFNVELGNGYGYARRVYILSNGNRMGLDFLCGVRYFLGNDSKKEAYARSDNYADYGFEKNTEIDGVTVFKNKYDADLGFVLPKAMLKSDFDTLNRAEKEQALLQVAVIPDDRADALQNVPIVKPEDLDLDVVNLEYEIVESDGVEFKDNSIISEKDDASFTISVKGIPKSQLLVSFDNLLRDSKDGVNTNPYEIYAEDSRVRRCVFNHKSRQGVDGLKDHDINMGLLEGDDQIKLTLSDAGVYTYDKFYLSAMKVENYDKYASSCIENKLEVESYDDRHVEGVVNAKEDGVLFLSLSAYDNWDIYVDGQKAEEIEGLDTAFIGTELQKGSHRVELKYANKSVEYGSYLSLLGVALLAIVSIRNRQKRNA